jgi:hypothetical protein
MISDLFEQALTKAGTGQKLACILELKPSDISNIRTGQRGIQLKTIDRLVDYLGFVLVPADHEQRLKDALKTVSVLWAEAEDKE